LSTAVLHLRLAPSEFWQMRPRHFWVLFGAKMEETGARKRRRLSRSDKDDIKAWLMGAEDRW